MPASGKRQSCADCEQGTPLPPLEEAVLNPREPGKAAEEQDHGDVEVES
jgi:hypothetical protein